MRNCYDYNKFLDKKNAANNSLELFGTTLYNPDVVASRDKPILGANYFSNELDKLKKLDEYIKKKTLACKDVNPNWSNDDIVKEVNSRIELAITNLEDYIRKRQERNTGRVVSSAPASGGYRRRTFKCRTNICKDSKKKHKTKRRSRKLKHTKRMKRNKSTKRNKRR